MTEINDLVLAGPRRAPAAWRGAAVVALALSPLWSLNLLTWLPFTAIACRRRRTRDWAIAAGYGAATAGCVIWVAGTASIGADAAIAVMIGASIHACHAVSNLGRSGGHADASGTSGAATRQDTAIASALAAREHRAAARRILATDPILARDLRIGRPDQPREYDDGGLVDVNHAPASALTGALGLTEAEAARLVAARAGLGLLQDVDDLTVYASIDPRRVHSRHDLIVFGPA